MKEYTIEQTGTRRLTIWVTDTMTAADLENNIGDTGLMERASWEQDEFVDVLPEPTDCALIFIDDDFNEITKKAAIDNYGFVEPKYCKCVE